MKRIIDVVFASCGLIALSPLLGLAALAIRISMGSPVLYRQMRPGLHGRPFRIVKFRSMTDARDEAGNLLPQDRRLTRLGVLMRRTSLDELPELWNVLKGEMSLVGPRPLLMEYLEYYTPEQMRRHRMKPGMTGLAQIAGRHRVGWQRRFELDVWYVDHWSLRLDARIIRDTFKVLAAGQGEVDPGSPDFLFGPSSLTPLAPLSTSRTVDRRVEASPPRKAARTAR